MQTLETKNKTLKYSVLPVLQMIIDTEVKKQGNSNVIILPRKLGFKPKDKVTVNIISKKVATVGDIAGIFKEQLKNVDTDKMLKQIKKELWGEY
jgi:antitoxin component of MazEF toxin-antitoxin module